MKEIKNQEQLAKEELRIGVFICHCGLNIAGTLDIKELMAYSETLSDVVCVKENKYSCADPGQDEVRRCVKEYKLNRVVVSACSPRMHEMTFRKAVAAAGLNPFLLEIANIREFASWPHANQPKEATEKGKDIIRMAVAKARLLVPLNTIKVPVINKALVIGGGIAGLNSAYDLAEMGYKVYLLENSESVGGHMAALDKTFPTLDCSICIEGPKMVDVSRHPNIEIIANADLVKVDGYVGNFKVKVRKNPRFVIAKNCTGCGSCADACPIEYPNKWDCNLGTRKAISIPFDQAVPLVYTINKDYCIECFHCVEACGGRDAIDFEQKAEEIEFEVGAIIVATGYDIYYPYDMPLIGYGKYPNVITSMEFERLILAAGPTGGKVIRSSDGKKPHSIAFILCVGSRDKQKYPYCSTYCCMYTLKHVVQLKEKYKDDIDLYVFYMDIRSPGKGYEEFYDRARDQGVIFIRGRVSRIEEDPSNQNLTIISEDSALGQPIEVKVDMTVLATASVPKKGSDELARILNLTRGTNGFFMESHPKLKPMDSPTDGIFFAGSCQGLKDIPYSVSQGSGAASRAATVISKSEWEIEPIIATVDESICTSCKVCEEQCPFGAIKVAEKVAEKKQPAIVTAASCHGCGTCIAGCPSDAISQKHFTDAQIMAQIRAALENKPEDTILAFLCNWCSYAGADLAGTSRFEYPISVRAIKVMCSGRVDRDFILEALRLGAGMIIVAACHLPYDCHYITGNHKMKKRMDVLAPMLQKLGMSPERFRVEYVSAAEGVKYAELITTVENQKLALGEAKIKAENAKLHPILQKMLDRKKMKRLNMIHSPKRTYGNLAK